MIRTRLQRIAEIIPSDSKVIDIGSDHGLLPIYLYKSKNCKCTATDINKNCIRTIKENIRKHNLENEIDVIKADGLNGIDYDDAYIVIAGMGTFEILNILKNHNPKNLIIQSNTDLYELRKELTKRYAIVFETFVYDKGKYYTIIKFEYGKTKYSYTDLLIGPFLKNNLEYIEYHHKVSLYIYNNILLRNFKKKIKYFKIIYTIKKTLKGFKGRK